MKSNFNALLVALAALDSGVVATGIWDYSVVKVIYIELYINASGQETSDLKTE